MNKVENYKTWLAEQTENINVAAERRDIRMLLKYHELIVKFIYKCFEADLNVVAYTAQTQQSKIENCIIEMTK